MDTPLNILVIDDDKEHRIAVRHTLQAAGLPVRWFEASTATAAIALLQSHPLDCILLSDQLPDKDGLTLLQEIRAAGVRTPLIMLTGQGDDQVAVELMKAGASDYMVKCRMTEAALSRAVRNSIRIHQAEMRAELAHLRLLESHDLLQRKNQELEQHQQQIQLQNLQLVEVSRLKSQFLSIMSHELRTPLNAIMGFSKVLLRRTKGVLNPQQVDMVERIYNNSRQLQRLIDEVLDFSKIGTEYTNLILEEFDLAQIAERTIALLVPLAHAKGLTLAAEITLTNPVVRNDRCRIRQILVNLLSNAIKFTNSGEITVRINDASPEGTILMEVCDTGIGIAAADLEHIFEPFRQLDQSTTRREGGAGLGLAITGLLVKMMHGQISVDSQPEQGSVFRVELPRQVPLTNPMNVEARSPLQRHRIRLAPAPPPSTIGGGARSYLRSIVI